MDPADVDTKSYKPVIELGPHEPDSFGVRSRLYESLLSDEWFGDAFGSVYPVKPGPPRGTIPKELLRRSDPKTVANGESSASSQQE